MSDGYIQSKQREIDGKLNTLLSKIEILEKKTENIDEKYEQISELLDNIKNENKHRDNIKHELEQETKQIINEMAPKVQNKVINRLDKKFDKHEDYFNDRLGDMHKSTTKLVDETTRLLQAKLQLTVLSYLLYKQGIIDEKEFHLIEEMDDVKVTKNKKVMDMLTEIRKITKIRKM